jgi:hemin uptake protein HemP
MDTLNTPSEQAIGTATTRTSNESDGRVVQAAALFGDRQRVLIEHGNERYVLRLTKNGKLILTK